MIALNASPLRLVTTPPSPLLKLTKRHCAQVEAGLLPASLGAEGRQYWMRRRPELGATPTPDRLRDFAELCAAHQAKEQAYAKLFEIRRKAGAAHVSHREYKIMEEKLDAYNRIFAQLDKLGLTLREPR